MRLLIAGTISCVLSLGASAGELSKRTYSRYFEWESTDCYKPSAPYIFELNQHSKWEAENYIDEVERYISCVESEAQNDYSEAKRKIADAIEQGRDEAIADVQGDLDNFVSEITR